MRMLTAIIVSSGILTAAFLGCSGDANNNTTAGNSGSGAGGSVPGQHDTCNGNNPDGVCNARGANPEDCACVDCVDAATCTGKCQDDNSCKQDQGEDCTCADCFGKVDGCPPASVGCDNNEEESAGCSFFSDDCTCSVCASDARCTGKCDNNGSCVPYLEPCSCADCANHEACGGSGPASSSMAASTVAASSTSGAGGAGGGAGGAGGGAGGAGGAGGN
jgi:hypothetical protein